MKKSEIESYVKAGGIAKEVKEFARGMIKPGVKLIDIADAVDAKIVELGGEAAFPVNLSLNEIAAHYTPTPGDEKVAEGILKVDIGVAVDGFIADTAFSVDLTKNNEFTEMISLNEKILYEISKIIKSGMMVKDVGDAAQDVLEKWNASRENRELGIENRGTKKFSIIKSLSGHELGKNSIHAGLTFSNYRNDSRRVVDDMTFAIEPFVTTGVGDIYEGPVGGIYVLQSDENVRDRDAREVLKFVREKYQGRPFCLRFLVKNFENLSIAKLKFILGMMVRQGILHEYPMLIEKSRAPVSQFENTFVVSDGKVVCTTGDEK
ncbi:MAG: type II methionyl aminopeptidase [archaeon]